MNGIRSPTVQTVRKQQHYYKLMEVFFMFEFDIENKDNGYKLDGLKVAAYRLKRSFDKKRLTLEDFSSAELSNFSILAECMFKNIGGLNGLQIAGEGLVPYKPTLNAFYTLEEIHSHCYVTITDKLLQHNEDDEVSDDWIKSNQNVIIAETWSDIVHNSKTFFVFRFITPFGRSVRAYQYQTPMYFTKFAQIIIKGAENIANDSKLLEATVHKYINILTDGDFDEYLNGNMYALSNVFRSWMYASIYQLAKKIAKIKEESCDE